MYFITPSNPNIFLIGIDEIQMYGFGEKDGKLCIYTKAIFDIGGWKEFYMININVEKCECCNTGIHVAGGVLFTAEGDQANPADKGRVIWIAAREDKYTRIFSINIDTKKFNRYQMLQETYPEFALLDLNLCCKCINPIIRHRYPDPKFAFLFIVPQKYQESVGIFRYLVSIDQSKQQCLIWKKSNSFTLEKPPLATVTNILINDEAEEALSVIKRSKKNGRIKKFSVESFDARDSVYIYDDDDDIDWTWHEIAFCDGFCLTRRKEENGNKSCLRLYGFVFSDIGSPGFCPLDYCSIDEGFPSIESSKFYISWRIVDKEYITKTTCKVSVAESQNYAIPSIIAMQTPDGSTVTIPLRPLSLSEAAYLSLARASQSIPLPLPFYGESKQNMSKYQQDPWMSQTFIKNAIGWPRILPLIKAPKLPKK